MIEERYSSTPFPQRRIRVRLLRRWTFTILLWDV